MLATSGPGPGPGPGLIVTPAFIGVVLLIILNRSGLLATHCNRAPADVLGGASVLGCAVLAVLTVLQSLGL